MVGVVLSISEGGYGLKYADLGRASGCVIGFMEIRDKWRGEFEKLVGEVEASA